MGRKKEGKGVRMGGWKGEVGCGGLLLTTLGGELFSSSPIYFFSRYEQSRVLGQPSNPALR